MNPLPVPTKAPPGSMEKMRVMRRRLLRGECLHHPQDNPCPVAELLFPLLGLRYYEIDKTDILDEEYAA